MPTRLLYAWTNFRRKILWYFSVLSQFSAFRPSVSQRCSSKEKKNSNKHPTPPTKETSSCFAVPVLQPTEALPLTSTRPALYHEISVGFQLCHNTHNLPDMLRSSFPSLGAKTPFLSWLQPPLGPQRYCGFVSSSTVLEEEFLTWIRMLP